VLHHLDAIVAILTTRLKEPWGPAHEHALLLVAVLAKVGGWFGWMDGFELCVGK
jgi:hypothetical protein